MIISVDDSGDPGLKLGKGSSRYFAIAAVCFADETSAELMRKKIDILKTKLGWAKAREFKFRKDRPETKRLFFSAIKGQSFQLSIVILDKEKLPKREYDNPSKLYNAAILKAIKNISNQPKDLYIHIDGEGGKSYRHRVKTYFRQNLPEYTLRELNYRDSKDDTLVQLADMVAGAARHSVGDKADAGVYLSMIKKHIDSISTYL